MDKHVKISQLKPRRISAGTNYNVSWKKKATKWKRI